MVSDALIGSLSTAVVAVVGIVFNAWLAFRTTSAQQRGERERIHAENLSSKQIEGLIGLYNDLVDFVQYLTGDTTAILPSENNDYNNYVSKVEKLYECFISSFGTTSIFLEKENETELSELADDLQDIVEMLSDASNESEREDALGWPSKEKFGDIEESFNSCREMLRKEINRAPVPR